MAQSFRGVYEEIQEPPAHSFKGTYDKFVPEAPQPPAPPPTPGPPIPAPSPVEAFKSGGPAQTAVIDQIQQRRDEDYTQWANTQAPPGVHFRNFNENNPYVEDMVGKREQRSFPEFVGGLGETGLQMISGFAAAIPAIFVGLHESAKQANLNDPDDPHATRKAMTAWVKGFMESSESMTYDPRSKAGKEISKALHDAIESYAKWGKEHISDPAFEAGYPSIAAWSQTAIEALPLLLLMRKQGPRWTPPRSDAFNKVNSALTTAKDQKGTPEGDNALKRAEKLMETYPTGAIGMRSEFNKSTTKAFHRGELDSLKAQMDAIKSGPLGRAVPPVQPQTMPLLPERAGQPVRPKKPGEPEYVPPDVEMTFEKKAPIVPRGTVDLPIKADPMKPKPVEDRAISDIEGPTFGKIVKDLTKPKTRIGPYPPEYATPGIDPSLQPELSGALRPPSGYEEAPKPTRDQFIDEASYKKGLPPKELIEAEKQELGQEYDKLYPREPSGSSFRGEVEEVVDEFMPEAPGKSYTVYRGYGRKKKDLDIAGGEAGPIFGEKKGRYYTFKPSDAKPFGPKLEKQTFNFKNPLILDSKEALYDFWIKAKALDKNGSPIGSQTPAARKKSQANIDKYLRQNNIDAVIVEFDDGGVGRDFDAKTGKNIKKLRQTFDIPQIYVPNFAKASKAKIQSKQPKSLKALLEKFDKYDAIVSKAEKFGELTAEQTELLLEQGRTGDLSTWKKFSESRGYTKKEISDFQKWIDVANEVIRRKGKDYAAGRSGYQDSPTDIVPKQEPGREFIDRRGDVIGKSFKGKYEPLTSDVDPGQFDYPNKADPQWVDPENPYSTAIYPDEAIETPKTSPYIHSSFEIQVHGNRLPEEAGGSKRFIVHVKPDGSAEFHTVSGDIENERVSKKAKFIRDEHGKIKAGPGIKKNQPMPYGTGEAVKEFEKYVAENGGIDRFKPTEEDLQEFDYSVNPEKNKAERYKKTKGKAPARAVDIQKDSVGVALAKGFGLKINEAKDHGVQGWDEKPIRVEKSAFYLFNQGKKAMSLDRGVEYLQGLGYPIEDISGMMEAISEELSGRPQHHPLVETDYDALYLDYLRSKGIDPDKPPPDGATFYSGLPIVPLMNFARKAYLGLVWNLKSKPFPTRIKKSGRSLPLIRSHFNTPDNLVKRFPRLNQFFRDALEGQTTNQNLIGNFNRRVARIYSSLKLGPRTFRENENQLNRLVLIADMLGKDLTVPQMTAWKVPKNVQSAYALNRSVYDFAFSKSNKLLIEAGKDPIRYVGGFFPHVFEKWLIREDGFEGKSIGTAKTFAEAEKMGRKFRKQGRQNIVIDSAVFEFPGEKMQGAVIGDAAYHRVLAKLEKTFRFTLEEAEELLKGIVRPTNTDAFFGHFMERKGLEGYTRNVPAVRERYLYGVAKFIPQFRFKKKSIHRWEKMFRQVWKEEPRSADAAYIKRYINDVMGVPDGLEQWMDHVLTATPSMRKLTDRYLGERPSRQLAGMTTHLTVIAKMGLWNVSAAMVNATQFVDGYAAIGAIALGDGMGRATLMFGEQMGRKFKKGSLRKPFPKDVQIILQSGILQQQGYAHTEGWTPTNITKKLSDLSMTFFRNTELFLRMSVYLGAYYKAKRANPKLDHHQLLGIARDANYRVNFNYGVENRPQILRQLPSVVAQFRTFQFNQWQFMANLKGAENARFWAAYLFMAGMVGIPGFMFMKNLIEDRYGYDMELEMKKFLYDWAGDDPWKTNLVIQSLHGTFGSILGVNASRRVSPGPDEIFPSRLDYFDLMGAGPGSAAKAVGKFVDSEWQEGFRHLFTSPANWYAAIEGDPRPSYDRYRKQVDLTLQDRIKMAIGFGPISRMVEKDIQRIIQYEKRRLSERRKELITDLLEAQKDEDRDEMTEHWDDIMSELIEDKEVEKGMTPEQIHRRRGIRMKSVLMSIGIEKIKRKMTPRQRALFFGVARADIRKYQNIYKFKP